MPRDPEVRLCMAMIYDILHQLVNLGGGWVQAVGMLFAKGLLRIRTTDKVVAE
jgi:hypothetical protein